MFDIRAMSKIKNGGLDQYGKVKALTWSAVKGLTNLLSPTTTFSQLRDEFVHCDGCDHTQMHFIYFILFYFI